MSDSTLFMRESDIGKSEEEEEEGKEGGGAKHTRREEWLPALQQYNDPAQVRPSSGLPSSFSTSPS